ncbi:MAG: 50S ribosomal protein L30 [Thioalkalivibrio sp.]|nr:50S ribosomal protein L30 [Thioalkalivibrio sp.]
MAKTEPKKLRITQVRSGIGRQGRHRRTLLALGIKRHQSSVIHDDTPAIRGMINQIGYLLDVQEVD